MAQTWLNRLMALAFGVALVGGVAATASACPGDDDSPKSFYCPGDDDSPKSFYCPGDDDSPKS